MAHSGLAATITPSITATGSGPAVAESEPRQKIGQAEQVSAIMDDRFPAIAAQIDSCDEGEPVLMIGRQMERDRRTGELGNFGLVYALGQLSDKPAELDPAGEGLILPTDRFALLSRFSMRDLGDFSTLKIRRDPLGSSSLSGRNVSLEDVLSQKPLHEVLGMSQTDLDRYPAFSEGLDLSLLELAEAKKPAVEIVIGENGVEHFLDGLEGSDDDAEALYYAHDFSLLRAMLREHMPSSG